MLGPSTRGPGRSPPPGRNPLPAPRNLPARAGPPPPQDSSALPAVSRLPPAPVSAAPAAPPSDHPTRMVIPSERSDEGSLFLRYSPAVIPSERSDEGPLSRARPL